MVEGGSLPVKEILNRSQMFFFLVPELSSNNKRADNGLPHAAGNAAERLAIPYIACDQDDEQNKPYSRK